MAKSQRYSSGIYLVGAFFFLLLLAIFIMQIFIISGAVTVKKEVENMVTPKNVRRLITNTFTPKDIQTIIGDSFPSEAIQTSMMTTLKSPDIMEFFIGLVSNPSFINAVQQAILSSLFQHARYPTRDSTEIDNGAMCKGMNDSSLCDHTKGMCQQLTQCLDSRNITQCQKFGMKAFGLCSYEGIY